MGMVSGLNDEPLCAFLLVCFFSHNVHMYSSQYLLELLCMNATAVSPFF